MTSVAPPLCYGCKHQDTEDRLKCGAFPAGIPQEILLSRADHRKPFPGDKGIRFDPKTKEDADYADALFAPEPTS